MLKSGNGLPHVCAANLLRTVRGTVPYELFKGIAIDVIDKPIGVGYAAEVAAQETIRHYEPRIQSDEARLIVRDPELGGTALRLTIKQTSRG